MFAPHVSKARHFQHLLDNKKPDVTRVSAPFTNCSLVLAMLRIVRLLVVLALRAARASRDPLLLRVARGERGERAPVWLMRQAGRHMAAYRALCAAHPSFREVSCRIFLLLFILLILIILPILPVIL